MESRNSFQVSLVGTLLLNLQCPVLADAAGMTRELLDFVKAMKLVCMVASSESDEIDWKKRLCKEQCPVDVGEEDHVRLG